MSVGSNDLRINDAFLSLSPPPAGDAEEQLPANTRIFLNVDVQAGSNAFSQGIAYRLHVILLDHTNSFINRFNQVITGHLNSPGDPWSAQDHTFTFGIGAVALTTPGADSLLSIEAVLTSGVTGQGVSVFEGSTIVVAS